MVTCFNDLHSHIPADTSDLPRAAIGCRVEEFSYVKFCSVFLVLVIVITNTVCERAQIKVPQKYYLCNYNFILNYFSGVLSMFQLTFTYILTVFLISSYTRVH